MTLTASDRLSQLGRTDKCVLSNAQRLIYAPTHPRYRHVPGLWDDAHFYNHPVGPLVTLALVNDIGAELALTATSWHWQPDYWQRVFEHAGSECVVTETARMGPDNTITIQWVIRPDPEFRHAVLWTAQGSGPVRDGDSGRALTTPQSAQTEKSGFTCSVQSSFELLNQPPIILSGSWTMSGLKPDSVALMASQGRRPEPRFDQTPFYDTFDGHLHGRQHITDVESGSLLFGAMHVRLSEPSTSVSAIIHLDCPAFGEQVSADIGPDWASFYEGAPSFRSSNPWFDAYFDYRLFGLRMNSIPGGTECIPFPGVCEGPGYFRAPITYSAQCHILETRWFPSPALAQGSLLNFVHNQQADGRYIGYLGPSSLPGEFFYHANWGRILALDAVHPDPGFLHKAYASLVAYVEFFDRERDPEGCGLYDILNHYETGQEYMHRYVAVEPTADEKHWGNVFRLKGVDVSVYLYQIKQALAEIAERNQWTDDVSRWKESVAKTGHAILTEMWDPTLEMFFDIDPATGNRTGVKAAVCFYPYLTDLVDESHLAGLKAHLFNPSEFWTTYPVPSSSVDDPFYNTDGLWKGERKNCPWNGRVWPMTNSHVAELLAECATRFQDPEITERCVSFISKYVEMLFFDGDVARPNSFEHYHPDNGRPSIFRGVDDYQHSWVLDLIIQYVCGVRPVKNGVWIDPLPFELDRFEFNDVVISGRKLAVRRSGKEFIVLLDGELKFRSVLGRPVFVTL